MRRNEAGFTLVEVTIIVMVLAILAAILLPQLGGFNRLARIARVEEDLGAICAADAAYVTDTGESSFWNHGWRDPDTPDRECQSDCWSGTATSPT